MHPSRPAFWIPHKVASGDTLAKVAEGYRYGNAGPILAFNCDKLPGSVREFGGLRRISQAHIEATSRENRIHHALGVEGALDPQETPVFEPLASNQINSTAVFWDDPAWQIGNVITVVSRYDVNATLDPATVPVLEIPWTRDALEEYVELHLKLRRDLLVDTYRLINAGREDLEKLKETLFAVDLLAAIATGGKDLAKLSLQQTKAGVTVTRANRAWYLAGVREGEKVTAEMLKREALKLLRDRLKSHAGSVKGAIDVEVDELIMEMELPEPIRLDTGLGFWIDNTIGWLSPSKVAGGVVAIIEEDADIAWWGAEAVDAERTNRIIADASRRAAGIDFRIRSAQAALKRSFYDHRVFPT